jgi:hypothetical protein
VAAAAPVPARAERIHAAYRGHREDVKRDFGGTLGKVRDIIADGEKC